VRGIETPMANVPAFPVQATGGIVPQSLIIWFQNIGRALSQILQDIEALQAVSDVVPTQVSQLENDAGYVTSAGSITALFASASGGLSLGTSYADITGATLTLAEAGTYLISGVFDFAGVGADTNESGLGQLVANGVAQTGIAAVEPLAIAGAGVTGSPVAVRMVASQQWLYVASAGHVIKLQARKTGGTGFSICNAVNTTISALKVG
jgi:hypothetical protein